MESMAYQVRILSTPPASTNFLPDRAYSAHYRKGTWSMIQLSHLPNRVPSELLIPKPQAFGWMIKVTGNIGRVMSE